MKTTSFKASNTNGAILFWHAFRLWALKLCPVILLSGLLAGCDTVQPAEDPEAETTIAEDESAVLEGYDTRYDPFGASKTADRAHWADGYVWAYDPTNPSYTASGFYSFNRTGGAIQITKPAGTTGQYKVRFNGLSNFLGATSTVHVTGYSSDDSYCKPVQAKLTSDVVTVRCFDASSKVQVNAYFSVLITRNYTDLAYAYAGNASGNDYAPPTGSSWNPAGAIRVFKSGTGSYQVQFSGLGSTFTSNGGHVQVNSVGTENKHCKVTSWGGSPDFFVYVQCYNKSGGPVDSKFNVLVLQPSLPLAYAWANSPTSASYTPSTFYSSNPGGGGITITRSGTGVYTVLFSGFSGLILDGGNVQVTAYGTFGTANTQCKVGGWGSQSVNVLCFKANGTPDDSYYTVLLGS